MVFQRFYILAFAVALALSACSLGPRPNVAEPTLVATLAIVAQPNETARPPATHSPVVQLQVTETPGPTDDPGTGTVNVTATQSITPWPNNTATPGPSPTKTRTPTWTRIPTRTLASSRTPTITYTPTITFTPTPPQPLINLLRPGLRSKVLSPIQMEMYAYAGDGGIVIIELIGEDGRMISRQMLKRDRSNYRFWIGPEVPFEIQTAAEMARLQVRAEDAFGRIETLSSVDLFLLSVGRNEINPPAIDRDPYLIRQPKADSTVSGGVLVIDGLARPVNESALFIELVNEENRVLSVKQIVVPPPVGPLSHTPFTVEIPYKVSGPTPVRLVIRQEGSRIPGTVALSSQTIILAP